MDLSFITNQSPTVQALISVIIPLLIAVIKGIVIATTALKKLPTGAKAVGAIGVILGSLCFQLGLIALFIHMQWFELPSFVMIFFGGVAMKALIGLISGLFGPSIPSIPSIPVVPTVGGKRRKH
jgi:hypothetical protein